MSSLILKKVDFKKKENIFCAIIIFFYFVTFFLGFLTKGKIVDYYLFSVSNPYDTFMDFFNSVIETEQIQHCNNYPPLALLFYRFLSYLSPFRNTATDIINRGLSAHLRGSIYGSLMNYFILFFFLFVSYFIIKQLLCCADFSEVKKSFISVVILFSGPFIFAVERGNIITLTLLFLLVFFLFKDSENRKLRILAFIALAVSANLKYYPAFFGVILLKEKRFKDGIICAVIGFVLFLVSLVLLMLTINHHFNRPLFSFSLFEEMKYCFMSPVSFASAQAGSIFAGSAYTSIQNVGNGLVKLVNHFINKHHMDKWYFDIPNIMAVICFFGCMFVFVFSKEKWVSFFGVTAVICFCLNSASGFYSLIFMSIPLVYYFCSKENSVFVSVCYGLIFSFIALPIKKHVGNQYPLILGYLIPETCLLLLLLYCFIRTVYEKTQISRFYLIKVVAFFCALLCLTSSFYIFNFIRNKNRIFGVFGGKGTIEKPYLISSASKLTYLSELVNSGVSTRGLYFSQSRDIDLEGKKFIPIGAFDSGSSFSGTYDGNNFCIKNLYINYPNDNVGLFGYLTGTVQNLTIENGVVKGRNAAGFASVGDINARIINCTNYAAISGNDNCAAGICNFLGKGVVINCSNYGTINGIKHGVAISGSAGEVTNIYPIDLPESFVGKLHYSFKGEGTSVNPFEISSRNDIVALSILVNAGMDTKNQYFKQTQNIDLMNINWVPIGVCFKGNYFSGVYDGNGYFLENLYIDSSIGNERDDVGLFGYLCGTVKNLGIESGYISGACVGAIASQGSELGWIKNCYNKAHLEGTKNRTGGICDNFNGTVEDCINYGRCNGELGNIFSYSVGYIKNCKVFNEF